MKQLFLNRDWEYVRYGRTHQIVASELCGPVIETSIQFWLSLLWWLWVVKTPLTMLAMDAKNTENQIPSKCIYSCVNVIHNVRSLRSTHTESEILIRNVHALKNKYMTSRCVNSVYTLPLKLSSIIKKSGSCSIFCISVSVANSLIWKDEEYNKNEKNNLKKGIWKFQTQCARTLRHVRVLCRHYLHLKSHRPTV